ncbi:MAG: peptidoglycan bridge formation glycyltransferase FemA/FemB family protein [Ardenticatenaceae bacterium]|nr:peptidoglycan bridge formation glycyltransferase FemA/FemB family protein [Ardenticatenaceae bacterium]
MFDKWFTLEEQPVTDDDADWDAFVAAHPHGSILQTTDWARLKNRFNWSSQRVWLKQDGRFIAGAQILFKSAALGLVKIAYIPHGPLVDWRDKEQIAVLFNQIDHSAYYHGSGLVKIEPLLWQTEMPPAAWADLCARHNLLPNTDTIQPPNTVLVDLRPSLDDILAAMKQKTRYNIRLAERKEVVVRQGSVDDLPTFNALMQVTARRDGFGVHEPAYYKAAYELFAPDRLALFLAEFSGRPLAAIMVSAFGGKAIYLYGASSDEERQRMPTYALQWAAIQWAKEKGCHTYDLWGVPDAPEEDLEAHFTDRSDGLWGVYRAKRGYGGQVQRTVGAADRVYNDLVYKLYKRRRSS